MANLKELFSDPDFLDLPESEQDSMVSKMKSSENPLQEALHNTGDILAGGFKRQIQAGPASFNTITGGPATEFAHGVKTEGLVKAGLPENLSEAISSGTDPQAMLEGKLSTKLGETELTNPSLFNRFKASQVARKGRQAVSRLLPAINLSEDVKSKRPSGAQVEGLKLIKKTSNPLDIFNRFSNEKNKVISTVDDLIENNNHSVSPGDIRKRAEEILSKQFANSSDEDRISLRKAIDEEMNFVPTDVKTANSRKRFLYQKNQALQKAQRQGKTIVSRPEQALTEDAFAQAYKEAIENALPEVSEHNSRFAGLESGELAASKLVEGEAEQTPMGERVASQTVGRPSKTGMIAALIRELPIVGSSPRRLTALIEKLGVKYGKLISKSEEARAPRLIGKEFTTPDAPPPQAPYYPYNQPPNVTPGQGTSLPDLIETVLSKGDIKPYGNQQYAGGAGKVGVPVESQEIPYNQPYRNQGFGKPGPYSEPTPEVNTPYSIPYSGGAGKPTPPVERNYEPFPQVPYKKHSIKELAKRKKRS